MRYAVPFLAFLLAMPLAAQEAPSVTASGQAEIRVVPDEIVISLGVETFAVDIGEAKRENDARMEAVLEAARGAGVPEDRLTTDYLSIAPEYEYRLSQLNGYRVRRGLEIRLRDLDVFEDLLTQALASGATHVHGVDFRTTELRKHRDEARALALDAAREKAEAMATRLGGSLGDPIRIAEGYVGWNSGYGWWGSRGGAGMQNVIQSAGPASGGSDGPTSPGQIAVTAQVSVTFALGD